MKQVMRFHIIVMLAAATASAAPLVTTSTDQINHVDMEKIDHVMVGVGDLKRAATAYADLFADEFYPLAPLALDGWGVKRSAVSDINQARAFFGDLFGTVFPEPHTMPGSRSQLSVDGLGLELITGSRAQGNSWEGASAVSFKVPNHSQAAVAMEARGLKPLATRDLPTRKVSLYAGGAGIGMGIELIEYRPLAHPIVSLELRAVLTKGT